MDDIHELVNLAEISNLVVHEERARRLPKSDDERTAMTEPLINNALGVRVDGVELGFRLRTIFADAHGEYVADVEIIYKTAEPLDLSEDLRRDFAERVAFMAVYPYVRSSITGSAARLSLPAPLLSIVRQGEFSVGDKLAEREAADLFGDTESEFATDSSQRH